MSAYASKLFVVAIYYCDYLVVSFVLLWRLIFFHPKFVGIFFLGELENLKINELFKPCGKSQ